MASQQPIHRANRHRIEFEALCNSGREEGMGVLVDISNTGALLDDTDVQPKIGSVVIVTVLPLGEGEGPITVEGDVTRHTLNGFAIGIRRWHKPQFLED